MSDVRGTRPRAGLEDRGAVVNRREHLKEAAINIFHGFILPYGTFALLIGLCVIGQRYDVWETSSIVLPHEERGEFVLEVSESGDIVFKVAEGVSEDLRQKLLSTKYESPEAAEYAVSSTRPAPPMAWWWPLASLGMRSAEAHAVAYCTTSSGKVTRNNGSSRHLTKHRFDYNGWRYTVTYHQIRQPWGWVIVDTFYYEIPKRYC